MLIEVAPWMAGVCQGGLFTRYRREFEVLSPIARFATVSHYVNGTYLCQSAIRDTGLSATPLNLIHCAQRNWDSFTEQEKSRTIEVVTGCILSGMTRRHYREWHDLASQVAMSLFEYPAPTFMSLTFDCRTPEDEEILLECLTPILIMRRGEWWNGFRKHCLGELDKDFRPKKLEIFGPPNIVGGNYLSEELMDSFFD
jgi:hypothetical protein